jgi:hypothetical protein
VTLKDLLARMGTGEPTGPARDVAVEAGFALVHLLKRTGQLDEAVARLDDIARLAPARAREAPADRRHRAGALRRDARAVAREGGRRERRSADAGARGDLQARAGADDLAIATFRAAVARDASPAATISLATSAGPRGDERDARPRSPVCCARRATTTRSPRRAPGHRAG